MVKYSTFLSLFIISVISFVFFFVFYLRWIFDFLFHANGFVNQQADINPAEFFSSLFTPGIIISVLVLAVSTLAVRILGVVCVAKNKTISDGEKVLWVIGFIMMGFITSIVFLIMAKGKNFTT